MARGLEARLAQGAWALPPSTGLTAKSTGGSPLAGHMPIVPNPSLCQVRRAWEPAGAAHNPILAPPQVQLTYPWPPQPWLPLVKSQPKPTLPRTTNIPLTRWDLPSNVQAGAHVTILRQIALEKSAPPLLFPPAFHFWLFQPPHPL